MLKTRGHVLSREQVKVSGDTVSLTDRIRCNEKQPTISVQTDPVTGDVIEIHIACSCGEQIVLDCHYDGEFAVRKT